MLTAHKLHVAGRRHTLLPATTAEAHRGEVLLIQADGQERRTALALSLTGRMKPTTGSVALGHDATISSLRRRSALIDSPNVNAPEHHLTARSLTSEDLAMVPLKFRDRTRPTEWLVKHGFRDVLDQWIEELDPERLLHLQLELALANRDVELLVVDSPDRHTADVTAWLPLLEAAVAGDLGRGPNTDATTPSRPLLVVGVVARFPNEWNGPAIVAGNADSKHDTDAPETAIQKTATPEPDSPQHRKNDGGESPTAVPDTDAGTAGPSDDASAQKDLDAVPPTEAIKTFIPADTPAGVPASAGQQAPPTAAGDESAVDHDDATTATAALPLTEPTPEEKP